MQIANLKQEKQLLVSRMESLQASLQTTEKSKLVTQELCVTLEKEIDRLKKQQKGYQKENAQLKQRLEEAQHSQKTLDHLLQTSQQDRDHLLHIESMKNDYQLEMNHEVQRLKASHKLQEQQWNNKEYDYNRKMQQLETRVRLLQEQIVESRQLREEYIQKVGKHDTEIQELRSAMGQSMQQMVQESSLLCSSPESFKLSSMEETAAMAAGGGPSSSSPKTSTPYKHQSRVQVTSPLSPHTSPFKPANKIV